MSLFQMSGAELAAALAQPAPAPPPAYPRASADLQPILASIAALSRKDQAALIRAFRAAEEVGKPKRIAGGNTFRGWADFAPALTAAQDRAIEAGGPRWWADPDMALWARVPGSWVACKLTNGRSSTSPRDVHFPRAQFWLGGTLPVGPVYADYLPCDPSADVRTIGERQAAERKSSRQRWEVWTNPNPAPAFALEPTPEDIGEAAD